MALEDEISRRLLQGYTPAQLIEEGYKKSTVYKVNQEIKAHLVQTKKAEWNIKNISPAEPRAMPKQSISVSFQFENNSDKDMYLYKAGIWAEWMPKDTWVAQNIKDLIKSGQKRNLSIIIAVPENIALGEYGFTFGAETQYLPASDYQPLQTQWTEPMVFHVKEPIKNMRIFLSHSTRDLGIVRQLENQLDCYGISVIIGEDKQTPGAELKQKFEGMIRDCNIFIALMTEDGINSQWVLFETNYAKQINKPMILLKEDSVTVQSNYEWIPFSKHDPPELLLQKIMKGINYVQGNASSSAMGAIVGLGLLALLLGALSNQK